MMAPPKPQEEHRRSFRLVMVKFGVENSDRRTATRGRMISLGDLERSFQGEKTLLTRWISLSCGCDVSIALDINQQW